MKNVEDLYPLTPMQQLMLTHALVTHTPGALVERFACTLSGELNVAAFRGAWQDAMAAHPVLRTCFLWEGLEKPLQLVRKEVSLPWHEDDSCGAPAGFDAARTASDAAGILEFDLTRAPLWRLDLARFRDDQWQFTWHCHHLLLDGYSIDLLLREIFVRYESRRQGMPAPLDRPRPFRDYVAWIDRQDAAAGSEFWQNQLRGFSSPPRLPIELTSKDQFARESRHEQAESTLSAVTTSALREFAAAHGLSANTIVQGVWALLLSRYCDIDDVVFGVTVSGRAAPLNRIDSMIGPFTNNLPLRVSTDDRQSLVPWLRKLQVCQSDLQPVEHYPLNEIHRAVEWPEGRRMFDTLFVFENHVARAGQHQQVGKLEISDVQATVSSAFPLTIVVFPGRELLLRALYDSRRFEAASVARLVKHFVAVLNQMLARPEARLGQFSLAVSPDDDATLTSAEGAPSACVVDSAGRWLPAGLPGELCVAAELAPVGASPEENGVLRRWIATPSAGDSHSRLWRTGYRAVERSDGEIEFLGPSGAPLQIEGYGVVPREVEETLVLHPSLTGAAVVSYQDRRGEAHLAAYVVPSRSTQIAIESEQSGLLLSHLREYLSQRLPSPMIPTVWRSVEELPYDAGGQLAMNRLPRPVAPRPESAGPYVAPRDELESRVAEIWADVLGVERVGTTDSFMDLGGYSSLAVTLLVRLEEQFDRHLPLASLLQEPTVAHLADLLRRRPGTPEDISLVPIRSEVEGSPLFCIHPAGGTVFCYLELAGELTTNVPIYGLQAQGIDGQLPPHESVEEMAAHYIGAIQSLQPSGPYHLCGWSSGGIVAFETARQLQASGEEIALLALCDAGIPRPGESFDEDDVLPMLAMMFPGEDKETIERLREADLSAQVEYFRKRAETAQLVVAGAGASHAQRIFSVFQTNMKAVVEYRPSRFEGAITLIRAGEQVTPIHEDPHLGWQPWASEIDVHEIEGDHLKMFQQPAVAKLAEILSEQLQAAAPA